MNKEKKNISIGLDRMILRNLTLIGIDLEILKRNLEVGDKKYGRISIDNKGYEAINISTGRTIYINELFMNIPNFDTGDYVMEFDFNYKYGEFQIVLGFNAPMLKYTNNERNLFDLDFINNIPRQIESILADRGIVIDIEEAKISSIEMNTNIYNEKFIKTLEMLNACWKNDNEKVFIVESKDGKESLKLKLSDRSIKIYDKAKEMKEKGQTPTSDDIVRIEVSTNHNTQMKRILGEERKLKDLANNFENIEKFYLGAIEKNIKIPFEKYVKKTEEHLLKELQNGVTPRVVFERYTDISTKDNQILDIEMFKNAVKKHYKLAKKGSPTSVIKGQLKRKAKEGIDISVLEGNIEKIETFIKGIGL